MVYLLQVCLVQSKHLFPLCFHNTTKHLSPLCFHNTTKHPTLLISHQFIQFKKPQKATTLSSSSSSASIVVHAAQKNDSDDQQFEVDPEKAKEALQKLDQQLLTLSKKQVNPPKIRATDVKLSKDEMIEDIPEISGSFLTYLTIALLIFTIFYNVLFYSVIKPSIDGPDSAPQLISTQTDLSQS